MEYTLEFKDQIDLISCLIKKTNWDLGLMWQKLHKLEIQRLKYKRCQR